MSAPEPPPVLEIIEVRHAFRRRGGEIVAAIRDVTLSIARGETVALVGESGSGKSTLARIALGLLAPDAGEIRLLGEPLYGIPAAKLRRIRTAMQPVFQDSGAAFNPRRTVLQLLAQAIPARLSSQEREARIIRLLEQVRLSPATDFLTRFPHELSGGQRQRLAIARAMAMDPVLIVADEPLSGADVSTRGQILNLMLELRERAGVSFLFITHDIAIARAFAHRVAVMYRGAIVEQGDAKAVIDAPADPYTRRLVAATRALESPDGLAGATQGPPGTGGKGEPARGQATGPRMARLQPVAGI